MGGSVRLRTAKPACTIWRAPTKNLADERRDWIDYIQKLQAMLPSHGFMARHEELVDRLMLTNFRTADAPAVAEKLDAAFRRSSPHSPYVRDRSGRRAGCEPNLRVG
jgi:hypothetical protein